MRVAGIPLGVLSQKNYIPLYPEELFFDFNDDFENKGSFETAVSNVGVPIYSESEAVVSGKSILMQGVSLSMTDTASLAVGDVSFELGFRAKFNSGSTNILERRIISPSIYGWTLNLNAGNLRIRTYNDGTVINNSNNIVYGVSETFDVKIVYNSLAHTLLFYKNDVLLATIESFTITSRADTPFFLTSSASPNSYHMDNFYFKLL